MPKKPTSPRFANQLVKLNVALATGEAEEEKPQEDGKGPAAVALGRKSGLKGGAARIINYRNNKGLR